MNFKKDGVYIQVMDQSNVSICETSLSKSWFEEYEVEKPIMIGVNSVIFYKILSIGDTKDKITLKIGEDECEINMSNAINSKYFKMPLIDLETDTMEIPENTYDLDVVFKSKELKIQIDQLGQFGSSLEVLYSDKEKEFSLRTKSVEMGEMKIELEMEKIEELTVVEEGEIKENYSIKYMQMILQFAKISPLLSVHITEGRPLEIVYKIDSSEENYVRFFLAPQIDV
jgi:proliferating cell nuclear antigen PCNA